MSKRELDKKRKAESSPGKDRAEPSNSSNTRDPDKEENNSSILDIAAPDSFRDRDNVQDEANMPEQQACFEGNEEGGGSPPCAKDRPETPALESRSRLVPKIDSRRVGCWDEKNESRHNRPCNITSRVENTTSSSAAIQASEGAGLGSVPIKNATNETSHALSTLLPQIDESVDEAQPSQTNMVTAKKTEGKMSSMLPLICAH
jgi:hypothetical protein